MINIASKLYDKLLNIIKTQNDKLSEDLKKRVNLLNKPKSFIPDFDEDN